MTTVYDNIFASFANPSNPVVKSIQRGRGTGIGSNGIPTYIAISPVDPSKCAVFLSAVVTADNSPGSNYASISPYLYSLTESGLYVEGSHVTNGVTFFPKTFTWMIIEFY